MCYKCDVCRSVVPHGKAQLKWTVRWTSSPRSNIQREFPVCEKCHASLMKGVPEPVLRRRFPAPPPRPPYEYVPKPMLAPLAPEEADVTLTLEPPAPKPPLILGKSVITSVRPTNDNLVVRIEGVNSTPGPITEAAPVPKKKTPKPKNQGLVIRPKNDLDDLVNSAEPFKAPVKGKRAGKGLPKKGGGK